MEDREPLEDRIFGFLWRWFWRILLWGVAALIALCALFALVAWAEQHPERWAWSIIGGLLGVISWNVNELRKLAAQLVTQNARLLDQQKGPLADDEW